MAYTTINKSTDYFNAVTFTGTAGSGQSITGVGFRPDWLWIKHRTDVSTHRIQDVVRGPTKIIPSNDTAAESTSSDSVTSFDSDGFTHGTNSAIDSTGNVVAWCWLAGGSQGSSNTDGAINTTYTSVSTTAGFSISKYTGTGSSTTIGHGLGARPDLVITKRLDTTANWVVTSVGSADSTPYQTFSSNDANLGLNLSRQISGSESVGDNRLSTNSSSTIRNIGNHASINASGGTYIAYCFRSIPGYSKIGSYTGAGSTDGPFIYTGFKPAFVLIKQTNTTNDWFIWDNKTSPFNVTNAYLRANTTGAAGSYDWLDLVSNGIKIRNTSSGANTSGGTYIYMAFGQSLVGSNNVPCTAR